MEISPLMASAFLPRAEAFNGPLHVLFRNEHVVRQTGSRGVNCRFLFRRKIVPARAILVALILAGPGQAFADCKASEIGTRNMPLLSPPLGEVVIGSGRLQFYSAPNPNWVISGVFVIPNDELIAYAQSNDGWSSVMYSNLGNGDTVSGWVKSSRLKATGTVGH